MTVVVTRITNQGIIFCTDRRLSIGNQRSREVTKFLPIHRLNAGICYFGVAQVRGIQLTRWLRAFVQHSQDVTISDFANNLRTALTAQMLPAEKSSGTGFQIAGYETIRGVIAPTFWHVRNFSGMNGYGYLPGTSTFDASEDFLQRDVANIPVAGLQSYLSGQHHIYRNGMLFPYVQVFSFFEQLRGALPSQNSSQWTIPSTVEDIAVDTEFELVITEQIFRKYGRTQPVGGGIQTHVVKTDGIYKFNSRTKRLAKI